MIIIDDIKAINKDIAKAKNFKWQIERAKYWIVKLSNIYPDYEFQSFVRYSAKEDVIFLDYELKEVY